MRVQKLALCVITIISTLFFVSPRCNDVTDPIPETKSTTTVVDETTTIEEVTAEATTVETTKKDTMETTAGHSTETSKYGIPSNGGKFKSYTNYRMLNTNSSQWTKVQCHTDAHTDTNGLRKVGDYYCVAMGSYYSTTLGDLFEIKTEGGTFKVILCDFKANQHTDTSNQYTAHNNCVIEFYVDMNTLHSTAKQMGDISYADSKFSGKIVGITKIGNYFE